MILRNGDGVDSGVVCSWLRDGRLIGGCWNVLSRRKIVVMIMWGEWGGVMLVGRVMGVGMMVWLDKVSMISIWCVLGWLVGWSLCWS